jgi:V8-like Glu-specific endopeptidase
MVNVRSMGSVLKSFPLPWGDRRVQDIREALAATIWELHEIQTVTAGTGVPPYVIDWSGSAWIVWTRVLDEAAAQEKVVDLLEQAAQRKPALRPRFDELDRREPIVAPRLRDDEPVGLARDDHRWKGFSVDGRERQIVETDHTLLDIAFLERGVRQSAAVCRLVVSVPKLVQHGTGFRIGPKRIITNHHVLHDWDDGDARALSVQSEFGYELDLDGKLRKATVMECDPGSIRGDREHDFALIETIDRMPDTIPSLSLVPMKPVEVGQRVIIVQHPEGLPKKIALAHNLVRHVDDDVLQYWTDTKAGSSGSPVFSESWDVVGLHHWWVPSPFDDGAAYRNQGRNIRRVAERIALLEADG